MTIRESIPAIRQLIADIQTSDAIERLIELIGSNKAYSDMLRHVRVIQADWSKLASQNIKGTISEEDGRLANNQINDKLLAVLDLIEAGKFTLEPPQGEAFKDQPIGGRQAWRLYLSGGIISIALALLGWNFFGKGELIGNNDDCPAYEGERKWKIMILPFRQTGDDKTGDQALEIAEGLNSLIERTPKLAQVVAIVHEKFDIASKYPTSDEAEIIADECDAKMIVWGRIKQDASGKSYKLDVRYRLLEDANTPISGDTTLVNLLKMSDDGQLIRDLDAVTKRLYNIVASRLGVPLESRAYQPFPIAALVAAASSLSEVQVDSIVAQMHESVVEGDTSKQAEDIYTAILEISENDSTALVRRGAIRANRKDYEGAIADWEKAAFNPKTADHNLLKMRVEAYQKTGDLDRATKDLAAYAQKHPQEEKWVNEKTASIAQDKAQKIEELSVVSAKSSRSGKKSTPNIIDEAVGYLKLGMYDEAEEKLSTVPKKDAKKPAVISVKIDTKQRKSGDEEAQKEVEKAKRSGVTTKDIKAYYPEIESLEPVKQQ
jgi:Effector-associated domain 11